MSADLARVRSSKPTAPVWSALFNHALFERNVMRIVAGFASEFSEGACLLICAVIRLFNAVVFITLDFIFHFVCYVRVAGDWLSRICWPGFVC